MRCFGLLEELGLACSVVLFEVFEGRAGFVVACDMVKGPGGLVFCGI